MTFSDLYGQCADSVHRRHAAWKIIVSRNANTVVAMGPPGAPDNRGLAAPHDPAILIPCLRLGRPSGTASTHCSSSSRFWARCTSCSSQMPSTPRWLGCYRFIEPRWSTGASKLCPHCSRRDCGARSGAGPFRWVALRASTRNWPSSRSC